MDTEEIKPRPSKIKVKIKKKKKLFGFGKFKFLIIFTGKEYSRLEALNPDTVFSSSSSSSEAGDLPQRPSFRWDGNWIF